MKLKEKIKEFIYSSISVFRMKSFQKQFTGKRSALLIGTPLHGNLGDQAIAIAEVKLLNEIGFDNVVEIDNVMGIYKYYFPLKFYASFRKEPVFLQGGGNVGTLYLNEEAVRRKAIKIFKKGKIIIFPQSIYFYNSKKGKRELRKSQHIYSRAKELIILARGKYSYASMKEKFNKSEVYLFPDCVLSLPPCFSPIPRNRSVLFCLRSDKESNVDIAEINGIYKYLIDKGYDINFTDTVINENFISSNNRDILVWEKIALFNKYELVITDRLHGMLFSYLSKTPSVVLPNSNSKIEEEFDWIKGSKFITFVKNKSNIKGEIDRLLSLDKVLNNFEFDYSSYIKTLRDISNE